ncbi:ribonuclease P protein subunit p38-like isoform X2 [Sycon ciliatum]|uniref:ribonuclease P protein subunit p38-like isoform X2 n=1 Tax=Sycon ciliatum TaxID=27933 RepID=UPI0031F66CF0
MSSPGGRGGPLRKAHTKVVKSSLKTPLSLSWPEIAGSDVDSIKSTLAKYLGGCNVGRKPVHSRKTEASATQAESTQDSAKLNAIRQAESTQDSAKLDAIRQALAAGVNQCTRALEKDQLLLLLVCRSCPLPTLTQHLLPLAATRSCCAGAVPGLSDHLSSVIGVKRVLALGVKKADSAQNNAILEDMIATISTHLPRVVVPWLREVEVTQKDETLSGESASSGHVSTKRRHHDNDDQDDELPRKKKKKKKKSTQVVLKANKPPDLKFLGLEIKTHESDPLRQEMKAERKRRRRERPRLRHRIRRSNQSPWHRNQSPRQRNQSPRQDN